MGINPFATVETYPQMLRKIATLDFFLALLLSIGFVNWVMPSGWTRHAYYQTIPVLNVQVPLVALVPASIVAALSWLFTPHNRISDRFHIRRTFDTYRILMPLALGTGVAVSPTELGSLEARRSDLMEKVFYPFARTSTEVGTISKHYVTMAMDTWSRYWILLEFATILTGASILAAIFDNFAFAFCALLLALLLMGLMLPLYRACSKRALDEVRQILSDPARKTKVQAGFRGL
jgi:hypothetical protein